MYNKLLSILDESLVRNLKATLSTEEFNQLAQYFVDHTIKSRAELTYDMNAAVNSVVQHFPGRDIIYVTEIHELLRQLGIVDYTAADFAYIQETLKRLGILVEPDPKT